MRFTNLANGAAFDPNSTNWPEKACVSERFVNLRIHRRENHVVAETPVLCWEIATFMEAINSGKSLKYLLSKAINVIPNTDEYDGKLKYAIWSSEDGQYMFQLAYSELEANICS